MSIIPFTELFTPEAVATIFFPRILTAALINWYGNSFFRHQDEGASPGYLLQSKGVLSAAAVMTKGVDCEQQRMLHVVDGGESSDYMVGCVCHFVDKGDGRVYAVASGIFADERNVSSTFICVSEFSIHKLSTADKIISQGFSADVPRTEDKFVNITGVKNYICDIYSERIHNISAAFIF